MINKKLAEERGLTPEKEAKIEVRQREREGIYKEMEGLSPSVGTDRIKLKALAEKVTKISFELQELWGFTKDSTFHFWFNVPHCTCPKIDNRERMGVDCGRIISSNCPIHSLS
jgi:hypothetical protein